MDKKIILLSEHELERMFEEFLDDVEGQVQILGYEYYVSNILKDIDREVYKESFLEWLDSEVENGHIREVNDGYMLTNEGG